MVGNDLLKVVHQRRNIHHGSVRAMRPFRLPILFIIVLRFVVIIRIQEVQGEIQNCIIIRFEAALVVRAKLFERLSCNDFSIYPVCPFLLLT